MAKSTPPQRPGVMLYFDILKILPLLSDEEKGILFTAILEYGATEVEPKFDGKLAVAWVFIKNASDRDNDRYVERCYKNRYAAYCRIEKLRDPDAAVMSYNEWFNMQRSIESEE